MAEYDRYVGAQVDIAQSDPSVMVINARRLMEDIGWNANSGQSGRYLEDGVHYTGLGAQSLSAAAVAAMMGEIHVSGCPNDPGAVTLQSSMTLVVDIGGTLACTNQGQLTVAQALTLEQPALKVELTNGFIPAVGDRFKLLSFDSIEGEFSSVTLPALPFGASWNTDELYTTGTISIEDTSAPDPPATPEPPTISVTSGGSQSITLPGAPSPIAFTLNGTGTLTVTASSSNATMLPDSGISISSGCGSTTLDCTMTLAPASGQTGSSIVSITVGDTHGQSAVASVTLEVEAAAAPPPEPGTGNATGNGSGSTSTGHRGGGGSLDILTLLSLVLLGMMGSGRTPRTQ
jgi:hypothetical protein